MATLSIGRITFANHCWVGLMAGSRIFRGCFTVEYNFGEIYLKCQFGIANPDYPALIKRRQFILDIDAYSAGAYEPGRNYSSSLLMLMH